MRKPNIKDGFFTPIIRYINYKVIVPMKRERRGPEYVARGTAVGLFFGFSPMFWQMNFVLLAWVIGRFFKWHFSLPIGLAWTWVSNTVTNLPLFYLYYLIGNFIIGDEKPGGYKTFMSFFNEGLWSGIKILAKDWGIAILLGSFIIMVTTAALGYFLALRYAKLRDRRKIGKGIKHAI